MPTGPFCISSVWIYCSNLCSASAVESSSSVFFFYCVIISLIDQRLATDFGGQVTMLVSRVVHTAAVRTQNRAFFKRDLDI